jgi:amidase
MEAHDTRQVEGCKPCAAGRDATCVTRREFLVQAGGLSGIAMMGSLGVRTHAAAESPDALPELVSLNALELSHKIRSKQVSCVEVMKSYLAHIERYNPKVNAIVSLQPADTLLQQARERDAQLARGEVLGWMHGFPHAVKDLAATKGIRTSHGSPLLDSVPDHDEIFVERLRRNGVILVGKTNVPEMGFGSQSYNPVFGTTLNAYDQTKCAGGSSGGAAVSLALRMLPVADGSDMMGSLRNPAGYNNVFGFRTSYGRVPSLGGELFLHTLSVEGPMGRSVPDVAMLLSVMAGPDARVPFSIEQDPAIFTQPLKRDFHGTRIGWLGNFDGYLEMQPGILELCGKSFAAFESAGCIVEPARPEFSMETLWSAWLTLRHALSAGGLAALYNDPQKRTKLKPEIQWEIEGGLNISAMEFQRASSIRSDWYRALLKLFERYEYLLLPSAQVFPFDAQVHWPTEINGKKMDTYHRWMEVVLPATMAGLPAISVPVGFGPGGLPMGMQVIGRPHADLAVLQLAYAYEQAAPWTREHLPPLLTGRQSSSLFPNSIRKGTASATPIAAQKPLA